MTAEFGARIGITTLLAALVTGCGSGTDSAAGPSLTSAAPAAAPGSVAKPDGAATPPAQPGSPAAPAPTLPAAAPAPGTPKVTQAQVAKMSGADFWAATRSAQSAQELQNLVKWGNATRLHESVWTDLWRRIESPDDIGQAERASLVAEATRLADAVQAVTGDRAFAIRIREYTRANRPAAAPGSSVKAAIAEARKALTTFKKPEVARAKLAAARAEAEANGLTAELAEIAKLEAQLPPAPATK